MKYQCDPFYNRAAWRRLRQEVLREQHYECQYCKARGYYVKATHVHHEYHRDKYPQYELTKYVVQRDGTVKRNLTACCRDCHETVGHPDRMGRAEHKPPLTEEKW
mgnify:CR=1 FL=1|jgi:5-methylcytosine-specific restriction endonuclease McrA